MNRLHFNENAPNFRNLPIQPYTYSIPTPPPITPGLMSPVGSNMMGSYCQTPTPTPPTVNKVLDTMLYIYDMSRKEQYLRY